MVLRRVWDVWCPSTGVFIPSDLAVRPSGTLNGLRERPTVAYSELEICAPHVVHPPPWSRRRSGLAVPISHIQGPSRSQGLSTIISETPRVSSQPLALEDQLLFQTSVQVAIVPLIRLGAGTARQEVTEELVRHGYLLAACAVLGRRRVLNVRRDNRELTVLIFHNSLRALRRKNLPVSSQMMLATYTYSARSLTG